MNKYVLFTLASMVYFLLPSIAFATPNSSYNDWAYMETVHAETQTGMQNIINVTNTTILGSMTDCHWVEFYLNDNTTQLNFTNIPYLSDVSTHCVYAFNATAAAPTFWFGSNNNTNVGTRSNASLVFPKTIVNETGYLVSTLGTTFGSALNFVDNGGYVRVSNSADGANYTGAFGNCTESISVATWHPTGSTTTAVVRDGFTPAGLGGGQEASVGSVSGSFTLQQGGTGITASNNLTYFSQTGKNTTTVYNKLNGSHTQFAVSTTGNSPIGIFAQANGWMDYYFWAVRNRTCNGTEPYLVIHGIITVQPFTLVSNTYNESMFELTNQSFNTVLSYDAALINNITFQTFTFDSVNYTPSALMYSSGQVNFTVSNVTIDFLGTTANNTQMEGNWTVEIEWSNASKFNYTVNVTPNITYAIFISNVNVSDPYGIETDSNWLYANISNYTNFPNITLNKTLTYNVTNYSGFSQTVYLPFLSDSVTNYTNISYYAWLNVTYNDTSRITNLSNEQQVHIMAITNCTAGTLSQNDTITFLMFDEETDAPINETTLESSNTVTKNESIGNRTYAFTFNLGANTTQPICIYPEWATLDYTSLNHYYKLSDYPDRDYYVDTEISAENQNVTLYLLNESLASEVILYVYDVNGNPVQNAIVQIQRYFIGNNTYKTVAQVVTDFEGKGVTYLKVNNIYYRFIIQVGGEIVRQTDQAIIICAQGGSCPPYYLTLYTEEGGQTLFEQYYEDVAYTCDNQSAITMDGDIFTCSATDTTGVSQSFSLLIKEYGALLTTVYNLTTCTSSSCTIGITIDDVNNTLYSYDFIMLTSNGNITLENGWLDFKDPNISWGAWGNFLYFIVQMIGVVAGMHNPLILIITSLIGVVVSIQLGFGFVTVTALGGLALAAVIFLVKAGR